MSVPSFSATVYFTAAGAATTIRLFGNVTSVPGTTVTRMMRSLMTWSRIVFAAPSAGVTVTPSPVLCHAP